MGHKFHQEMMDIKRIYVAIDKGQVQYNATRVSQRNFLDINPKEEWKLKSKGKKNRTFFTYQQNDIEKDN